MNLKSLLRRSWILLAALAGGLLLALLDASPKFWSDWLVYGLLIFLSIILIQLTSARLRTGRRLGAAAWVAFGLRLAVGVALWYFLPLSGYTDNPAATNGYLFKDAYYRDQESWNLARSGDPLIHAYVAFFNQEDVPAYTTDQYGGVLALSGFVYRYLSADTHRPFVILIFTATVMALGALFAGGAGRSWFGDKVAVAVTWMFALYPEGVLLGSSQMREPFVMFALAVVTYGVSLISVKGKRWLLWAGVGCLFLLLFQSPVLLIALVVLGIAAFLEPNTRLRWRQLLLFAGILIAVMAVVVTVWSSLPSLKESSPLTLFFTWLENNYNYQGQVTERASGQVQRLLDLLGENFRLALYLGYGAARPVLPAALTDLEANPVWYVINLFRALGWYLLLPLMAYATAQLFKKGPLERRRQLLWLALVSWILVLAAAANGGADAWDNPRYRAIFLVWQVILAGWGWFQARKNRDPWFIRFLLVEGVFILVFTWWYVTRVPELAHLHPSVEVTLGVFAVIALPILVAGWIIDRNRRRQGI